MLTFSDKFKNLTLESESKPFSYINCSPDIQFEAAWALTNIASGSSEQTWVVVNEGIKDSIIHFHITRVCNKVNL